MSLASLVVAFGYLPLPIFSLSSFRSPASLCDEDGFLRSIFRETRAASGRLPRHFWPDPIRTGSGMTMMNPHNGRSPEKRAESAAGDSGWTCE